MRFRIRTLLLIVALFAVTIAALPPLYDWLTNPPSLPLSNVIETFNYSSPNNNTHVGLTEAEVISSIKSQLPTLVEAERVKKVLRRIVRKRRVPPSTTIRQTTTLDPSALNATNTTTTLNFLREPSQIPFSIEIHVNREMEIE